MKNYGIEVLVGIFVVVGVLALGYLSVKLGKLDVLGSTGYDVSAEFSDIGGLKVGSNVEIAGVEVGRVTAITLKDYQALVRIHMDGDVKLQDDTIASVKTKGLIGEKFVSLTPGGSEKVLRQGSRIRETESAIDFERLISQYIFGKV